VETSGAVTLPARLFAEIVSRLSADSPVTLSCKDGQEQVELTSLSGSYEITGISADDFPDLPLNKAGVPITVNPNVLMQALKATLFASSSDESKQILTGVNLCLDEKLECAATDGHRLAAFKADLQQETSIKEEETFQVTIPARSLREVERMLHAQTDESLSIYHDRGQIVIVHGEEILTTRILDGSYPNYRQLIPSSFSRQISINKKAFVSSLERMSVLADQHNNVIKIKTNGSEGTIEIKADAQDVGKGKEELAADCKGSDIEMAFNVRYLVEGLKAMQSEQILLQCNEANTPAILKPIDEEKDYTYLIMPVQIRS
jgi:DNA polymerase-3 subunit beta